MQATEYIDLDEGRDFAAPPACHNCGAKASDGTWLTPVALHGAILDNAWACDDCMAEEARLEAEGGALALLPSCDERQRIIDRAESVAQLVNQLRAHDQTGCPDCAAIELAACDDCGCRVAPHLAQYDAEYRLTVCPACAIKQARLDAIIERHNADRTAA